MNANNSNPLSPTLSDSKYVVAELIPEAAEVVPQVEHPIIAEVDSLNSADTLVSAEVVPSQLPRSEQFEESIASTAESAEVIRVRRGLRWWLYLPFRILYSIFQFASLVVLLGVASTFPLLQLASLGYMLEVGRRVAAGEPWRKTLPGLSRAGRLGVIAAGAALSWIPVWFVTDYAYSAELISHGSRIARNWQIAAWVISIAWVIHISWAALRGGRWYHFLWPAPMRFVREIWRPATWSRAEDAVWNYTIGLQLPKLMWLGLRAAIGAIIWLAIPSALIVIGMRGNDNPGQAVIGMLGGAVLMTVVLLYLPFLQIQMARENRFRAIFDVRTIRKDFKRAPWAFFLSFLLTLALALPLYLFRIEKLPEELMWLPSLFFVLLMLPARFLVGWALRRGHREIPKRLWLSRWTAWILQLAAVPFYLLFLYLATLTSWDGALIVISQHAFLAPVPFVGQ
jgi:Protein of unknown function (DUF4013)